jgi:hypothetical protein
MGLLTWMATALVALNVLGALGALFSGRFLTALVWMLSGTVVPFAIWLAIRILADLLVVQNRMAEALGPVLDEARPAPAAGVRTPDPVRSDL